MKHIPPKVPTPMTFEQLVQHAKTSDVGMSPADVERLLQRLQTRIQLEGIPQPTTPQPSLGRPSGNEPRAAGHDKLVKTGLGKTLLGGVGLLAAAALYYSAETPTSEPHAGPPVVGVAAPTQALAVPTPNESPALRDEATTLLDEHLEVATETRVIDKTPVDRAVTARRAPSRSPNAHRPTVSLEPSSTAAPMMDVKPAPAPSAAKSPAPSLDSSLEQLERAERALRSGNPSAALTMLSPPVIPTLSSRAEALRAVALCQSGKTAAGTKLAQQHLARNPASPYEKRLQAACGKDL